PAGPLEDAAQGAGVEVGHVRVDDLPAGGGQVVAGVRDLDVAPHRPPGGLLAQVDEKLVGVVQVLEPVAGGERVEPAQPAAARGARCGGNPLGCPRVPNPGAGGERVDPARPAAARGDPGVELRAAGVGAGRPGVHGAPPDTGAAGMVAQLPQELPLPAPDV